MDEDDVPRSGRRLDPDPRVRKSIVTAAATLVREEGVRGLSVAQVLSRAGLGTRAFYRHFDSKDQLVSAVFLDMARAETRRLRKRMAARADPVDGVVAWIDGRLDLATANNGGKSKAQLTSQLCAALSFDSAGVRSLFSSRNSCAAWMQRRMILRNADVPVGLSGCRWFFCPYSSNGI